TTVEARQHQGPDPWGLHPGLPSPGKNASRLGVQTIAPRTFSFVPTGSGVQIRQLQPALYADRNQLLRRLPELPVDEIGGEATHEGELFWTALAESRGSRPS